MARGPVARACARCRRRCARRWPPPAPAALARCAAATRSTSRRCAARRSPTATCGGAAPSRSTSTGWTASPRPSLRARARRRAPARRGRGASPPTPTAYGARDELDRLIYQDLRLRLPELLLMRVDKLTMANAVEARVPFLDHELVELAMAIPRDGEGSRRRRQARAQARRRGPARRRTSSGGPSRASARRSRSGSAASSADQPRRTSSPARRSTSSAISTAGGSTTSCALHRAGAPTARSSSGTCSTCPSGSTTGSPAASRSRRERHELLVVVGARPNFVKVAPVVHALSATPGVHVRDPVHTGQHYDAALSDAFLGAARHPAARPPLGVGSGAHARADGGGACSASSACCEQERLDAVLVAGDVNSTMAAALAAAKALGRWPPGGGAALARLDDARGDQPGRHRSRVAICCCATAARRVDNLARRGHRSRRASRRRRQHDDRLPASSSCRRRGRGRLERHGLEPRGATSLVTLHRPASSTNPSASPRRWTSSRDLAAGCRWSSRCTRARARGSTRRPRVPDAIRPARAAGLPRLHRAGGAGAARDHRLRRESRRRRRRSASRASPTAPRPSAR